jgi:hypothetical protein
MSSTPLMPCHPTSQLHICVPANHHLSFNTKNLHQDNISKACSAYKINWQLLTQSCCCSPQDCPEGFNPSTGSVMLNMLQKVPTRGQKDNSSCTTGCARLHQPQGFMITSAAQCCTHHYHPTCCWKQWNASSAAAWLHAVGDAQNKPVYQMHLPQSHTTVVEH